MIYAQLRISTMKWVQMKIRFKNKWQINQRHTELHINDLQHGSLFILQWKPMLKKVSNKRARLDPTEIGIFFPNVLHEHTICNYKHDLNFVERCPSNLVLLSWFV